MYVHYINIGALIMKAKPFRSSRRRLIASVPVLPTPLSHVAIHMLVYPARRRLSALELCLNVQLLLLLLRWRHTSMGRHLVLRPLVLLWLLILAEAELLARIRQLWLYGGHSLAGKGDPEIRLHLHGIHGGERIAVV